MLAVVSTADLAQELGVTPETVARYVREGRFPGAFRRRGRWRIPMEEAQAFADGYAEVPEEEGGEGPDEDEPD